MNTRELFLRHIAQTSTAPLALEIVKAENCLLFGKDGRQWLDLIGGISVANTGHRHPDVLEAIRRQLDAYLHIMVYGEFIETPQVLYAKSLTTHLPASLNTVYFTNSGAEAVEGAMKLAKRVSNRTNIISFKQSYHGSTQGALSIIGSEYWRNAFRPLLPGIHHLDYGDPESYHSINEETCCVIAETVQAEAGINAASKEWMQGLRARCNETGALLILDEIQTGFGRTGKLWGFQHYEIVPDILLLGKALGGGMPLGAFVADQQLMKELSDNPVLGHITTFGGHPVSCASGNAAFNVLLQTGLIEDVKRKETLFRSLLIHPAIKSVSSFGLWLALEFDSFETNKKIIDQCIAQGLLTDWFLFAPECLRISPPLTISDEQIIASSKIILTSVTTVS